MRIRRLAKWSALIGTGGSLLQITACLGSDPQLTIGISVLNTLIANFVTTLYNLVLSGVAASV